MQKLILIKTNNTEEIKQFLKQKQIDYQIFYDEDKFPAKDIFAHYEQSINNKARQKELNLLDQLDLDEELNQDGEWWK